MSKHARGCCACLPPRRCRHGQLHICSGHCLAVTLHLACPHPPATHPLLPSVPGNSKAAVGGSEPADAIRAVNALLTRLDQLKASPNVMVSRADCCRRAWVGLFGGWVGGRMAGLGWVSGDGSAPARHRLRLHPPTHPTGADDVKHHRGERVPSPTGCPQAAACLRASLSACGPKRSAAPVSQRQPA